MHLTYRNLPSAVLQSAGHAPNSKLRARAATSALETLQQLVKDQNQALAKLKVQAGEATADACRLQERCDTADRFTVHLRWALCPLSWPRGAPVERCFRPAGIRAAKRQSQCRRT